MSTKITNLANKAGEITGIVSFDENAHAWRITSNAEPSFQQTFSSKQLAFYFWYSKFDPQTGKLRHFPRSNGLSMESLVLPPARLGLPLRIHCARTLTNPCARCPTLPRTGAARAGRSSPIQGMALWWGCNFGGLCLITPAFIDLPVSRP
jgi:hypothetical protein